MFRNGKRTYFKSQKIGNLFNQWWIETHQSLNLRVEIPKMCEADAMHRIFLYLKKTLQKVYQKLQIV